MFFRSAIKNCSVGLGRARYRILIQGTWVKTFVDDSCETSDWIYNHTFFVDK